MESFFNVDIGELFMFDEEMNVDFVKCDICGSMISEDEAISIDGGRTWLCCDCYNGVMEDLDVFNGFDNF